MEKAASSLVVDRRPRDVKDFSRFRYIVARDVQYVSDIITFKILERGEFDAMVRIVAENEIEIEIFRH